MILTVCSLSLFQVDMTESAFSILIEELIELPFVRSLDLSHTSAAIKFNMGPALATLLLKKRTLLHLRLYDSNLNTKSLEQLVRALRTNKVF